MKNKSLYTVLLLLGTLLTAAVRPCAAQTTKTLAVMPRSGPYAGRTFYTNSHALLVGIRTYAHLPKEKWLDYADKDAADLRDVLVRSYGFLPENVTVLLNEQATRANIESALSTLADNQRVKSEDRVLVFFSGHGQTVKLGNGGDMGFLIPYDANVDLAHPDNRGPYLASCLPMDHVWSYLQGSPAKHSLLLADACYGGLLTKSRALNPEKPNAQVVASLLARPAMQVLTAGSRDEEALEDPKLGHGAFTFKLLEELKAQAATPDSVFLASELAAALKTSVGNVTNGKQTPQFGNYADTEGDFVFAATEPQQVPALRVPSAPPATPQLPAEPPVRPQPTQPPMPALKKPMMPGGGGGQIGQSLRTKINPKDGAKMVYIPAGEFLMGDDDLKSVNPCHTVTLSGYWMYKNLVTVKQYKQFCSETGRQMPDEPGGHKYFNRAVPAFNPGWSKENHPIVNVSWNDAVAYAKWAGVSLPTEAQWEKAARGTDGRKFPWGNDFDLSKVWASKAHWGISGGTTSVGRYGMSLYGCTDMSGNVWQWCADWYDDKFWSSRQAEQSDPVNTVEGERKSRVIRGGSWFDFDPVLFRAAYRAGDVPSSRTLEVGFRCASKSEVIAPISNPLNQTRER